MKKTLIPFIAAVVSLSACREQVKEYDNSLPAAQPVSTVALPACGFSRYACAAKSAQCQRQIAEYRSA